MGENEISLGFEKLGDRIRIGYDGLIEFFRTHFFLVRDVYKDIVYPRNAQGVIAASITTTAAYQKLSFEAAVDAVIISTTKDVLVSLDPSGTRPMLVSGGPISLQIRVRDVYIAWATEAGTCYVWGVY